MNNNLLYYRFPSGLQVLVQDSFQIDVVYVLVRRIYRFPSDWRPTQNYPLLKNYAIIHGLQENERYLMNPDPTEYEHDSLGSYKTWYYYIHKIHRSFTYQDTNYIVLMESKWILSVNTIYLLWKCHDNEASWLDNVQPLEDINLITYLNNYLESDFTATTDGVSYDYDIPYWRMAIPAPGGNYDCLRLAN